MTPQLITDSLLVEPGSYITDASKVGRKFFEMGAIGFLNGFLNQEFDATKTYMQGVMDILRLLQGSHQSK